MGHLTGEEFAKEFERFVNGASDDKKKEFAEYFVRMHNTNMQSAFGAILKVVTEVANLKYVDDRNAISRERARFMVEGIKRNESLKLQSEDSDYWTKAKADEWIYSEHWDISILPFI